jgi:hypothetical protein
MDLNEQALVDFKLFQNKVGYVWLEKVEKAVDHI